ncbi:DEAD/DEAH box helicase [Candidatus Bathyarchaeota archaeon]|nr:DEAD/DEAH box helicase [Candidatus Bathyarchaeota archaeon]
MNSQPNVFKLLAKPIREGLKEQGFLEPTLPQTMAIPYVLEGENVLLIAPTGSGKTEAVLLPLFSKLTQQKSREGISLLYVTPLRALNRDMLKRLSFWSNCLGISVEVRHGDTEMKLRRKQAISPPDMLVTTPETLQAILPGSRMRQHLSQIQFVVIDEVHELAGDKRGTQLAVALERLRENTKKDFQRVGLSATIGNPEEIAQFIAGAGRAIKILQASPAKSYRYNVETPSPIETDYELAGKLRTSPEAAARIRRMIELVDSHRSTLIFVNSRQNAEMLGYKFSQLGRTDIAVHHGSLSKEERAQIEDEFKACKIKALVCTSTLELGIDIGSVDLVIQYLSPRQVNSLIQRTGRSGHRLDMVSKGVIITAFPDDTLESVAAVKNAYESKLEPVLIQEGALDVLAHQIVGILMDKDVVGVKELQAILRRAYPYRRLSEDQLLDVIDYLDSLGELRFSEEGKLLKKGKRSRKYYFENLSMIPDERSYPMVNVISDRKIGILGDEFMALDARVGLNIIVKGKVWRIVQIEQETGTVYVVPSEDPLAAIPGWDGEMIPLPFDLAKRTGIMREEIQKALEDAGNVELAMEKVAAALDIEKETLRDAVKEIADHIKQNAPLPTHRHIVVEAFDKYLIVHACFGEIVNRTLGGVFDTLLSDREIIVGWWNDGYRILIELRRKTTSKEAEDLSKLLFGVSEEEAEKAFNRYLDAKFPFTYKMRFVAQRFGALPRGKTMGTDTESRLPFQFGDTPIYDETIREAMLEKVDVAKVKKIISDVKNGKIKVSTIYRSEKPTPLAFHILEKYSDISELMAPEEVLLSNIEKMKRAIEARTARLLCMKCGEWMTEEKIKNLPEEPECARCGSRLLTLMYFSQDSKHLANSLKKRREGKELSEEELKELTSARRKADLILSYGKKAITALEVKGVGPETASRILGKMHSNEDEFYMDLLKAKIQYLRTREFWENKEKSV